MLDPMIEADIRVRLTKMMNREVVTALAAKEALESMDNESYTLAIIFFEQLEGGLLAMARFQGTSEQTSEILEIQNCIRVLRNERDSKFTHKRPEDSVLRGIIG